jgi:hypothetical protein
MADLVGRREMMMYSMLSGRRLRRSRSRIARGACASGSSRLRLVDASSSISADAIGNQRISSEKGESAAALWGHTHDRWERAVAVAGIACSGGALRVGWERASFLSIFTMARSFHPFVTNKNDLVRNKKVQYSE